MVQCPQDLEFATELLLSEQHPLTYQRWVRRRRSLYPWRNMTGDEMQSALQMIIGPVTLWRVWYLKHPHQCKSVLGFQFEVQT